ncbi:DUF4845 domain-containing protein [Aliikangiella sp. IMCC44653]
MNNNLLSQSHLNKLSKQQGSTMWTKLMLIFVIVFFGMLAFKMIPIYLEHNVITSSMQNIVNQANFKEMTPKQIYTNVQKRLNIDSVRGFEKDAFKVMREKSGEKYIVIKYSKKENFMSNIYILIEFEEEVRRKGS